jgi:2-(1,2-epoxy-1,2-dihydrophenyl)acetyl-CoA isomerase
MVNSSTRAAGGSTGRAAAGPTGLENVRLDVEDGIATLRLNRVDTLNALDPELVSELARATEWCGASEGLRGLVITGVGKGFSAGGHLPTLRRGVENPSELESTVGFLAAELNRTIECLYGMACPIVAAINGRTAGAGLSLALACDIRIASERAVFDFAYARVGATPDGGMTWFLPRLVGMSRAIELLIESPIVRPKLALDVGLVSAVVPPDALDSRARTLVKRLAGHPVHYVAAVKELARRSVDADLPTHLAMERSRLLASLSTEEARACLSRIGRGRSPA